LGWISSSVLNSSAMVYFKKNMAHRVSIEIEAGSRTL
jgi:hypothetical protein